MPLLVAAARHIIPRLPAGRHHAAAWVARHVTRDFIAPMVNGTSGLTFACDLGDDIARDVCLTGQYSPLETALLTALLRPGMTFVDVGANWGYFTLTAAHLVGERGRVVSLEPDPRMFELLRANVERNGLAHVDVHAVAAHSSHAVLTLRGFQSGSSNRGVSTVVAGEAGGSGPTFMVHAQPLDELLDAANIDRVDLVKIDVEGAEDAVIDGMTEGIRAGRYARVLLELHPDALLRSGSDWNGVLARLVSHGFRAYWLSHDAGSIRKATYASRIELLEYVRPVRAGDPVDRWPHVLLMGAETPTDGLLEGTS